MTRPNLCRSAFYVLALLMLFCFHLTVSAQILDSLRKALNRHTKEDTTKVNLYAAVAGAYKDTSTDSMVAVAQRGLLLTDKTNFTKGRARCLASLGVAYMFKNDLERADSICNVAISLLEKTKDSAEMGPVFYYIGNIRYRQTKYKEAILYFEKSIRFAIKRGDDRAVGNSLDNIGISYLVLGNNTQALNYFLKALKIWEKLNDNSGISNSLSDMARVYVTIGNNSKAVEYLEQSIAIQKGYNDVQSIVHCYSNAASIYGALKNDSAAIAICTQAIRILDSTGQQSELTLLLIDRGMSYFEAGAYDKAFDDYKRCLEPPTNKTAPAIIAQAHIGLGEVWMAKGNVRKSIPHLEIAYAIFRENDMADQIGPAADELGNAYEKIGDYPKALKYIKIGHSIRDSLFNQKNREEQQQLQFDYELEKKQNQIELLKRDKMIVQTRSEKQRITLWGLMGGLALVAVVALQLYRGRRKEKQSKETITMQAESLKEMNKFKDKIFSVLSHDLRGPINSISTSIDLLDEDLLSPKEFAELRPEMKKQLGALTFLLDNLLKWSKTHIMGVATVKPEIIDLYRIAQQNITLLEAPAKSKKITVYNNIPVSFFAFCDLSHIDIIVRNLISNAIKFTNSNGTITLSATTEGNTAKIHITDNGIGIKPEHIKKLFLTSEHISTHGTSGETGTGLGLRLCYEFIKANNGDISITSEEKRGSTFTVILPLQQTKNNSVD